jgi:hypothetical protein
MPTQISILLLKANQKVAEKHPYQDLEINHPQNGLIFNSKQGKVTSQKANRLLNTATII